MAANIDPIFPNVVNVTPTAFTSADTTTAKVIFTADATDGSRVDMISAASDDTAAIDLELQYYSSSVGYVLGTVNIPIGAGTGASATASIDILNQGNLSWLRDDGSIVVKAGDSLYARCVATMTAAKTLNIVVFGGDY